MRVCVCVFWQRAWLRGCVTRPVSPIHSHPCLSSTSLIPSTDKHGHGSLQLEEGKKRDQEENQEEERATVRGGKDKGRGGWGRGTGEAGR